MQFCPAGGSDGAEGAEPGRAREGAGAGEDVALAAAVARRKGRVRGRRKRA